MALKDGSTAAGKADHTPAQAHDAPAIPQPIVGTDAQGNERPLSGGSFVCVDGKLVRQEA
ncbi:hypothetical protein ACFOKF_15345 [Sphingobium rhizovicinum]|uniref:Uncharacterized protein n=1 Tax=Sphingobium rhizovicinum TaxID=432308 RepID=A0ABV7NGE5_9SPHN